MTHWLTLFQDQQQNDSVALSMKVGQWCWLPASHKGMKEGQACGGHYMGGEEKGAKEELEDRGGGKPDPELKEICE